MKCSRDALLASAETESELTSRNLSSLYQAASLIRNAIMLSKRWVYKGPIPTDLKEIIPSELQLFFQWCIKGKHDISDKNNVTNTDVEKKAEGGGNLFWCFFFGKDKSS